MFKPNLTSELLTYGVKETLKNLNINSFLELGSGSGYVTLNTFKDINIDDIKIVATDVMPEAKEVAETNFSNSKMNVEFRVGNLFEPIKKNETFDIIVSDVASISQKLNKYLPWYDGVPCNTGDDGLNLFNEIINNISKHLNEKSCFVYPVLSLCDTDKLSENINKVFNKNISLIQKKWPLKVENIQLKNCLDTLKSNRYINFEIKSGLYVFTTEIRASYF